ncbi:hypothetical protein [Streptacidiphilus sp. EB129]|uniref:hypothetical protein n=1 Tax=Streptacidiphilus sp. EB129 TaxID=3156262 RepID=UPI0035130774
METTSPDAGVRPATGANALAERVGPNPSGVLNELVMELARALGENPREVNLSLNRKLGVESRINQSEDVIRQGVAIARDWLSGLG